MHSEKKGQSTSVTADSECLHVKKIKGLKKLETASLWLNLSPSIVPWLRERISQPFNRFSDTFSKSAVWILIKQRIIQRWGQRTARMTHSEVATPSAAGANSAADAAMREEPLQSSICASSLSMSGHVLIFDVEVSSVADSNQRWLVQPSHHIWSRCYVFRLQNFNIFESYFIESSTFVRRHFCRHAVWTHRVAQRWLPALCHMMFGLT